MTNAAIVARTRVLLVEDDTDARAAYATALGRAGYDVVTVGTIDEASRAVLKQRPDLVVLDCRLPDGSGIALFHQWRDTAPMAKVPVVLLATLSAPQDVQEAARAGADAVVLEPCSGETLAKSLGRVVLGTCATPKPARYRMTYRTPLALVPPSGRDRTVPKLLEHEGTFHGRCQRCLRSSPPLGGDPKDAERRAMALGWAPRDEGWDCPVCIERYEAPGRPNRKTHLVYSSLGDANGLVPAPCRAAR